MTVVGLVVAGIVLLILGIWGARAAIRRARRQPALKVRLTIAFPQYAGSLGSRHLAITTRNVGRVPATITRWWLRLPDGCKLYDLRTADWSDRLPVTLGHGDSVAVFLPVDELVSVVDEAELKRAYAVVGTESGANVRCFQRVPVRDLVA